MRRLLRLLPFSIALVGLGCLVAAGVLVTIPLGLAVAGVALILVAIAIGGEA